jgi:hypothetical protein
MAKDKRRFKYTEVAIPVENELLILTLEEQARLTGISEGKLLVQWATAHLQGYSAGVPTPAQPPYTDTRDTGPMAAIPRTDDPISDKPTISTLSDMYSTPDDEDFDAFGDPD